MNAIREVSLSYQLKAYGPNLAGCIILDNLNLIQPSL